VSIYCYQSSCQNSYLSIPSGWIIAPDDADSQNVIMSYTWGTKIALTSGNSYCTATCEESYLINKGADYLSFDGYGNFQSYICDSEILIKQ
jgi:hypothetical protein